jgi:hypothetical protein
MKKYIAVAVASAALHGVAMPATSSASVPTYAGGAPIIGCQLSASSFEWLNPAVAPTRCLMLYRNWTGPSPIPADYQDDLHGIHWSHWGRATATATGWLEDNTGGPYRVTLRAWRLTTLRGLPAPLANDPICRDDIRYYSRVTVTMPANWTYAASKWTDAEFGPTRQC